MKHALTAVSSGARGLIVGLILHILPYFMDASSEGSDKTM